MEFELTSSQLNFYTNNSFFDSYMWNQGVLQIFPKVYSYTELNDAYNNLVKNNDSLRVRLKNVDGKLFSFVDEFEYINFPSIKVQSKEELMSYAKDFINSETDVYGQLVRCVIFQSDTSSGIIICAHHIVVDGYSALVMARQINAYLKNKSNKSSKKIQSYIEYITDEENHKNSKRFSSDKKFWQKAFSDEIDFNFISKEKLDFDFTSSEIVYNIPNEIYDKAIKICNKENISITGFFNTIYAAFIYKFFGVKNFTIGVPILNRTTKEQLNTIGLYMHIVPLCMNINEGSFLKNANEIEDTWLNLLRHQKFTQYDIKNLLKEEGGFKDSLFDFVADFLEFDNSENDEYKIEIPHNNYLSVPIEIHLQSFEKDLHALKIRYRNSFFTPFDIERINSFICNILKTVTENPKMRLSEIELFGEEERFTLLHSFNDTKTDYDSNTCIHTLFEKQAKNSPEKTAVIACDKVLTYCELNEQANKIANSLIENGIKPNDMVAFILPRKSFLFSVLLGILKTGACYVPIDSQNPKERIEYILSDCKAKLCITEDMVENLLSNKNISNPNLILSSNSPCYCIYTSGSTGKPKGAILTHKNVVNYCSFNSKNVFGSIIKKEFSSVLSLTTVGFDIFVTESLLPLSGGLSVVLATESQTKNQNELSLLISNYPCDVLQTTPTKMKILTNNENNLQFLKSFKAIILGGEIFDTTLAEKIKRYSDSKIYNIYGPTETTVWASADEFFENRPVTIGKPLSNTQIYIIDKFGKPVPIGIKGELCIGGDCVGAGYLNRPELTAEKFIDNPFGEGKLYKTGDLAYWRKDGNIVYMGRSDFQVKIRGLRIELGEIENALCQNANISEAVVTVRKDENERQLICAFYTQKSPVDLSKIKTELSKKLPKYMIPHIFIPLSEIPLTSSGKLNRKALEEIEIDFSLTSFHKSFTEPKSKREKIICETAEKVLNIQKAGTDDNFFDLGGDSLKAIEFISEIEHFGFELSSREIFESLTLKELSEKMSVKEKTKKTERIYGKVFPASAAQESVYAGELINKSIPTYNVPYFFKVKSLDVKRLERAVNELILRHESLRMKFKIIDGVLLSEICDNVFVKVEEIKSENLSDFIRPFDLSSAPLLRMGYKENVVAVDIHHIIADGESLPVFYYELNELYMGRKLKTLPAQYGRFSTSKSYSEETKKYWKKLFEKEITPLDLPVDFKRENVQNLSGDTFYDTIDINLHKKITEKAKALGITPFVYYMSCYYVFLSIITSCDDILVGTPMSGRNSEFLNSVGMFVNTVTMHGKISKDKTLGELFSETKFQSIEAIQNQNFPFSVLTKELNLSNNVRKPLFDVMLTYQSLKMTDLIFGDEKAQLLPVPLKGAKCDFNFDIMPRKDDVILAVEYCNALYKRETAEKLSKLYKAALRECLDEAKLIGDVNLLSEEDLTLLHSLSCGEAVAYPIPSHSTLYSLFEETAKKASDKICIRNEENSLTFGELLKISEFTDSKIRNITRNKKSIIAVLSERSIEMYAGIYSVIRGGNAYLPLSPDYPRERIEDILHDSGAVGIITDGKPYGDFEIPVLNMKKLIAEINEPFEWCEPCALPSDPAYVIYTSGSTGKPKGAVISHASAVNRILWMESAYPLKEGRILQKTPFTFDVSVWEIFWWGICGGSLAFSKPGEHFLPQKIIREIHDNEITHIHFVPSVFELFLSYVENHRAELKNLTSLRHIFLSGEALPSALVKRFYALFSFENQKLHNLYGPTECAVDVTSFDCTPDCGDIIPIGRPIFNTQIYILDKNQKLLPKGIKGELCIGGANVGMGYLNQPELTKKKFIDNPFGEGKLYRSGDLARYDESGEIIFCGRIDNQIKLHGQRIEIGEIESVMKKIDGITEVAVILKAFTKSNSDGLFAFYSGKELSEDEIKTALRKTLPAYMIPKAFIHISSFPLTQSGKLNRKALQNIKIIYKKDTADEKPKNEWERFICESFNRVLKIQNTRPTDDFFDLGGTSLSMISLLSEEFFEGISSADFISNSTPRKLSEFLSAPKKEVSSSLLKPLTEKRNSSKSMIIFPFAAGKAESFGRLAKEFQNRNMNVYFLDYLRSFESCERAEKEILKLSQTSEIYFYSHCVGSALAIKIISDLEKKAPNTVKYLFVGGSIPPKEVTNKNIWNDVPDEALLDILQKAGASFEFKNPQKKKEVLWDFRRDTDFATEILCSGGEKINCPTALILSPLDPFTPNCGEAKELWSRYANNITELHFLETPNHYFQSENSSAVAEIIFKTLGEK